MHFPGDRRAKNITIAFLCLYFTAILTGFVVQQLFLFISLVNMVAGLLVISFFIRDRTRRQRSPIEQREIVVLSLETVCLASSLYAVIAAQPGSWWQIVQYCIFSVHSILLALFLFFILTFKIKKLF